MNTHAVSGRSYTGPERRRHKVFVTRNSEYHCRDGLCVAVRDMRTGQFKLDHMAIGRRMSAGVRFNEDGAIASVSKPEAPTVGDQLCFSTFEEEAAHQFGDVITSPLRAVQRPAKELVRSYPN